MNATYDCCRSWFDPERICFGGHDDPAIGSLPVCGQNCAVVADVGEKAVLDGFICLFALDAKNARMWLADNVAVVKCPPGAVVVGQSHAHHIWLQA